MKKALYISQLIANAHPESVRLLFQANGITAPVSAKSIMDAYLVLGEPFLHGLFEIVYAGMKQSQFSNADGLEEDKLAAYQQQYQDNAAALAEAEKKTGFWEGFKRIVNTGFDIIPDVLGAYNVVAGILGGNKIDTGTGNQTEAQMQLQLAMQQMSLEQQKAAAADKTKTYLLIGAGVLVAILVLVMFLKKK